MTITKTFKTENEAEKFFNSLESEYIFEGQQITSTDLVLPQASNNYANPYVSIEVK